MKLLILAAIALAIGPKTVFAHDGSAALRCQARLTLEQTAERKLGYLPLFQTVQLKPFSKIEGAERFAIYAKHPRFGMDLAFLDYEVFDQGKTIAIEKVDVLNANNFRKGLSNLLFSQMMERQTEVERVKIRLVDVNLSALMQAMGRGRSCVDAFAATPAYQALTHFGFTKVSGTCNPASGEYEFVMEH